MKDVAIIVMPRISLQTLFEDAQRRAYIACYCEAWNLESFEAVIEAAEETKSPIIAGFNGGFLCHSGRRRAENLAHYAALGHVLWQSSAPAVFLLNETDDFAQIERAIGLGFNAVMVENERLELGPYRRLVNRVVRVAHDAGVSVEAALGRLACAQRNGNAALTDPDAARRFVEETDIDGLGVAVGNIHILTRGKATIQLDALERIHEAVDLPLVLHGGTGIPLKLASHFPRLGVRKINFGTILKQTYLKAVQKKLARYHEPMSPHPFIGMGGPEDALVAGREAVKQKVMELLRASGSAGKARRFPYPKEGAKC